MKSDTRPASTHPASSLHFFFLLPQHCSHVSQSFRLGSPRKVGKTLDEQINELQSSIQKTEMAITAVEQQLPGVPPESSLWHFLTTEKVALRNKEQALLIKEQALRAEKLALLNKEERESAIYLSPQNIRTKLQPSSWKLFAAPMVYVSALGVCCFYFFTHTFCFLLF